MNYRSKIATKLGFGQGLVHLGSTYGNVVCLGSDITASVGMNLFKEAFPERFFSFGIAEQNIAAVAAGLALSEKIPFFSTYGVFASMRCADQIRVSICYNNVPVKIGGAHAGISVGPDGATHQALEDISVMRALPGMLVLSPCDATQTRLATVASLEQWKGPAYIRFGREAMPDFTDPTQDFRIGKGQVLREGTDLTLIGTGHLTWECLVAAELLANSGIQARVVNIHTIKPIDSELIRDCAVKTGRIVTAEEHQIHGGLGSSVAEVVCQLYPVPMRIVGMPDCFGESGEPLSLMKKYGLCAENIVMRAKEIL
ncbi:MAG: transketolase family protein [Bacteroidales bacterium]|nr:transketolase family protein [Bacteroidales bacterium]HOY38333.1 transketolase C-terminal domain-containing protein [Bacteroidales bacterium]HQP03428.1 transketolase C-terminal domain-containing protein [Bacteroidales bacterium]